MTIPRHPPLSMERSAVPLRGQVTLVYLYWYPVLSLRDHLIAACRQSLNSVLILLILGPSLLLTVCVCTPSSPFPERTEFHGINVFWVLGSSSSWLVVDPLLHWMVYCLSACLLHNDWHHWIPLMVLGGALLALVMATN